MRTGVELIADERRRQIEEEGWSAEHDDEHDPGEMAGAASAYALNAASILHPYTQMPLKYRPDSWLWDPLWWKPSTDDPVRDLVKAGALIAAEIDKLQREQQP